MAKLGPTISALAQGRRDWSHLLKGAEQPGPAAGSTRLQHLAAFGSNPGNLRMLKYVPENVGANPALVVVLHGCTQKAAAFDYGTGWSTVADRYGFVLLLPEQQSANNANSCFNWFEPGDTRRDAGEALSIRQMIDRMIADHGIDRKRIFVTGLSAGGAMASTMLATYPEVFAGGAIVAGLPYGAATNMQEAFECMFKGRSRPAREWGDLVRSASRHKGPWPTISVWHGDADKTVVPANGAEIVKQWTDVHGLSNRPTQTNGPGFTRQVWRDAGGREVVESFTIANMAHGTPLATGEGEDRCGAVGPFLLEVGLSSTYHIAKFWGLTGTQVEARPKPANGISPSAGSTPPKVSKSLTPRNQEAGDSEHEGSSQRLPVDVQAVISKALKAAGLMRS